MPLGTSQFDSTNFTTPDDSTTLPTAVNNCVGLLNGALSADNYGNTGSNQIIALVSATSFPSGGWISVGDEIISYTGKSGNNLTGITRGAQSTTIRAHVSRSAAVLNFTAAHFNVFINAVIALQTIFSKLKTDTGTTDGGATVALTGTPVTQLKVLLWINGVFYTEDVDFTRSGTIMTFGSPPPASLSWTAFYFAQ